MKKQAQPWTFNPVDPEVWSRSSHRVLLLGAEPNGNHGDCDPAASQLDMGAWFRAGGSLNARSRNSRFYNNCVIDLACGLSLLGNRSLHRGLNRAQGQGDLPFVLKQIRHNNHPLRQWLAHLRFADLKRTAGRERVQYHDFMKWVEDDLKSILRYWLPKKGEPLCPSLTLVQGHHAQQAFKHYVSPALLEEGVQDLGLVLYIPHPSAREAYHTRLTVADGRNRAGRPVPVASTKASGIPRFASKTGYAV